MKQQELETIRAALAEALDRGDRAAALRWSNALDDLQCALWDAAEKSRPAQCEPA